MSENGEGTAPMGDLVELHTAEEAFGLLGNDTRVEILRALFEADGELGFSALHERVGVRDSGQFNYHLDKLVGSFVEETDDGYALSAAGKRVVGSILAGRYTKSLGSDSRSIDGACPHCGESLQALVEGDLVRIICEDCERNVISLHAPAGIFEDRPREEWPFVAERWTRQVAETVASGFCYRCEGPTTQSLEVSPENLHDVFPVGVTYTCERCGLGMTANVEAHLLTETAVVAFHHEHGVDPTETPIWELDWAVEPHAEVVSEDPVRVRVPIQFDDDRLVVTVDGDATVVDTERDPNGAPSS